MGAAIYLTEYAKPGNRLVPPIRLTTETLAGIPSIVYGLFGYLVFVKALHLRLSLLSGALTLAIMILPTIMRTTEEALRSIPQSYREASFGLGAGRLRTVFVILLPTALPGILGGVLLSVGRIVGETAALIYTAGTVAKIAGLTDGGRTLAVHMYALIGRDFIRTPPMPLPWCCWRWSYCLTPCPICYWANTRKETANDCILCAKLKLILR